MLNFQTFLILSACSIPFIAFVFVLPKFKKKEKKTAKQAEEKQTSVPLETKTEAKVSMPEKPQEKKFEPVFNNAEFSPEDFKGYLNNRQKNMSKPTRVDLPEGFIDTTQPFVRRVKNKQEKSQTVAEEIRSLSPELKALIFTGALDKKNFD